MKFSVIFSFYLLLGLTSLSGGLVDDSKVFCPVYGEVSGEKMETTIEEFIPLESESELGDPCLDDCAEYGVNCDCGTFYFQWCPCPWFPPSPRAFASTICDDACAEV